MKTCFFLFFSLQLICAQLLLANDTVYFNINIAYPRAQIVEVNMRLECKSQADKLQLQLPAWSPGYYQLMPYADRISDFHVYDVEGRQLEWEKMADNAWDIYKNDSRSITVSYKVLANKNFVAESLVDTTHAYIVPVATFLFPVNELNRPVMVQLNKHPEWRDIATGLKLIDRSQNTYFASNYDILFDSPLLIGKLTKLPTFYVKGVPHYFYAHDVATKDYREFTAELQRIIQAASAIIGDIPYTDYTFIGIGKGRGGIEHLNSTTVALESIPSDYAERKRLLHFLAHEYFHHYNAKRIRPIELGPFDYTKANKTKQLWVAEGITVYYEGIIMNRAGLISKEDLLQQWAKEIEGYELNEGKAYQSLADASEKTWEEGPFGNKEGRGISYYQKGPIVGLLLDLKIRQVTNSQRSLDDVMQKLYYRYYRQKGRGFTEDEFRATCEEVAGVNLQDIFDYVYTTKPLDYGTYFGYAGLTLQLNKQHVRLVQHIKSNQRQRRLLAKLVH